MIAPAVLDAMLAAGCTAQQIVAAVKADGASAAEEDARKRELDRLRKKREREAKKLVRSTDTSDVSRGHPWTERDIEDNTLSPIVPSPDKEIPQTPLENNLFPLTPKPTPSVAKATSGSPAGFPDFWEIYPNKVGKPDALKAFSKALKRTDLETMLVGLRVYTEKTDDRPWCNPSTWLNQDRWNDRPSARGSPRQPKGLEWFDEAAKWIDENERQRTETGARSDPAHAGSAPQLTIEHRPGDREGLPYGGK